MRTKTLDGLRLLLVFGLAANSALAADVPPRLTGIVSFCNVSRALLELSVRNRRENLSPLMEGDAQGEWEIVRIDPTAGQVTIRNFPSWENLQLGFTNTPPTSVAPCRILLESASSEQVLEVYQLVSRRTLIRSQRLPEASLSVQSPQLSTTNEAKRVLEELFKTNGIVIADAGTKFAVAITPAEAPALASLAPPPTEATVPGEMIPRGMLDFRLADVHQVLDVYAELCGRTVVCAKSLAAKTTLRAQTPLARAEAVWVLEATFHLAGMDNLRVGENFVCMAPPEALKRVPALDTDSPARRAYPQRKPADVELGWADPQAVLALYASLVGRQPAPVAVNVPRVRFTLRSQKSLTPAEAAWVIEALVAMENLAFERVGNDGVRIVAVPPR